jgi:hypothetical protein
MPLEKKEDPGDERSLGGIGYATLTKQEADFRRRQPHFFL